MIDLDIVAGSSIAKRLETETSRASEWDLHLCLVWTILEDFLTPCLC